jgi:hypothetical protein
MLPRVRGARRALSSTSAAAAASPTTTTTPSKGYKGAGPAWYAVSNIKHQVVEALPGPESTGPWKVDREDMSEDQIAAEWKEEAETLSAIQSANSRAAALLTAALTRKAAAKGAAKSATMVTTQPPITAGVQQAAARVPASASGAPGIRGTTSALSSAGSSATWSAQARAPVSSGAVLAASRLDLSRAPLFSGGSGERPAAQHAAKAEVQPVRSSQHEIERDERAYLGVMRARTLGTTGKEGKS